jgi:benzaldehyde dehydrogenase (NAD)
VGSNQQQAGPDQWHETVFIDGAFRKPQGAITVGNTVTEDVGLGPILRAGMVHVNDATPQDEATAPFGGIGQSGLGGRSGSDANLEESTERRWLTVNPGSVHYPY